MIQWKNRYGKHLSAWGIAIIVWGMTAPVLNAAQLEGTVTIQIQQGAEQSWAEDRGGVVIYLVGYKENPEPSRLLEIPQQDKQFTKDILPIVVGETIDFPNRDKVYHNLFSLSKIARFDLGLYKDGVSKSYTFTQIGVAQIFCNIHPQMMTSVMVLPNRGFAVSDKSGKYKIASIPDGTFTVRAFLKNGSRFDEKLTFQGAQVLTLDIQLVEKRIPDQHLNKFGKPYAQF